MRWAVDEKSKHCFVRWTINHSPRAPIKAFKTNAVITSLPPKSRTCISWYLNRWSRDLDEPTRRSMKTVHNPRPTYITHCKAIICDMISSGSHVVLRNCPVTFFIVTNDNAEINLLEHNHKLCYMLLFFMSSTLQFIKILFKNKVGTSGNINWHSWCKVEEYTVETSTVL